MYIIDTLEEPDLVGWTVTSAKAGKVLFYVPRDSLEESIRISESNWSYSLTQELLHDLAATPEGREKALDTFVRSADMRQEMAAYGVLRIS